MIIIMERTATKENIQRVLDLLMDNGFQVRCNQGEIHTVIDALGDKNSIKQNKIDELKNYSGSLIFYSSVHDINNDLDFLHKNYPKYPFNIFQSNI